MGVSRSASQATHTKAGFGAAGSGGPAEELAAVKGFAISASAHRPLFGLPSARHLDRPIWTDGSCTLYIGMSSGTELDGCVSPRLPPRRPHERVGAGLGGGGHDWQLLERDQESGVSGAANPGRSEAGEAWGQRP